MEISEETLRGKRLITSFSEVGREEYVPSWLVGGLKALLDMSDNLYSWEEQIVFEIGVALAPHIKSQADFQVFSDFFDYGAPLEIYHIRDELEYAVKKYASGVKQVFFQEIAQRRMEEKRKSLCVLCLVFWREPGNDVCLNCRKEYWREEQRLKTQLYQARKAGTPATLTLGEWITTLKYYNYLCAYCQTSLYEIIEHYIPITLGGGTTKENCVPACRSCNSKKQDKHPENEA